MLDLDLILQSVDLVPVSAFGVFIARESTKRRGKGKDSEKVQPRFIIISISIFLLFLDQCRCLSTLPPFILY